MYLELLTDNFPVRQNPVGRTAKFRGQLLGYVNLFKTSILIYMLLYARTARHL